MFSVPVKVVEQQPPAKNADQEHEERGHEDAVADHQRRIVK
jgi:hypothetical protein